MTNTNRNFHYIEASGVASVDTAELQSALDYSSDLDVRKIVLNGEFVINSPLSCDAPIDIEGFPYAKITYAGALTSSPVLSLTGYYSRARNLWLWCNHLCRGVLIDDMHHGEVLNNVRIVFAHEIALHCKDSWYGSISNIEINGARGVGLLADTCNSCQYNNVKFVNCWGFWHADGSTWDPTDANHVDLWTYASTHTMAETRTEYGVDCVEDWPTTDEVAEADRACVVTTSDQNCHAFSNIAFEPCNYGPLPIMNLKSTTEVVRDCRIEGGYFNENEAALQIKNTAQVTLDNVLVLTTTPAKYAVRMSGTTSYCTVRQVDCREAQITTGIVYAPSDETHTELDVEQCRGWSDAEGTTPLTVTDSDPLVPP